MNGNKTRVSQQKTSTRHCVWCGLFLDAELTTEEIKMKFRGKYYHPSCKALANEYTADVPGALADILRRTKRRAAEYGLEYGLGDDLEAMRFLMDLWEAQSGLCAETDWPMRCDTDHDLTFHLKPSLDRLDSSEGYVKSNVHLVTQWANKSKSDMEQEQFEDMVIAAAEKAKQRRRNERIDKAPPRVVSSRRMKEKPATRRRLRA